MVQRHEAEGAPMIAVNFEAGNGTDGNIAHDSVLPGQSGRAALPFPMDPDGENAGVPPGVEPARPFGAAQTAASGDA